MFFLTLVFTSIAPLAHVAYLFSVPAMLNFVCQYIAVYICVRKRLIHMFSSSSCDVVLGRLYYRLGLLCNALPGVRHQQTGACPLDGLLRRWVACDLARMHRARDLTA